MTDGAGSGAVSVGVTGLGMIKALELIPPHVWGIITMIFGLVATTTIIVVNLVKLKNTMIENQILKIELKNKKDCDGPDPKE